MSAAAWELRVYTLATAEALDAYATVYYPRHRVSLQELYGVTVHGWWTPEDTDEGFRLVVLMSYPPDADPADVRLDYRTHAVAAANMPGFDPSVILGVSVTMLAAAPESPLR